jgi:chromodomain-helicase-DNA-binding protein 4
MAYDDLCELENGSSFIDRFRRAQDTAQNHAMLSSTAIKRRHHDRDSDDFDSDEEEQPELARKSLRRSTRQRTASRQTSVAAIKLYDDDEEPMQLTQISDEDDEDFKRPKQDVGPSRRVTRGQNSTNKRVSYAATYLDSEDELANDDSDSFIPVTSDVITVKKPARRRRGRGRPSYKSAQSNGHGSEIEFETTTMRRSGRSTKATDYAVPGVDDEYHVVEEKAVQAPKYVSVKEIFTRLPANSEFLKAHMSTCESCGGGEHTGKGHLIPCQGCSYAYHKVCLGLRSQRDHRVTKVGPDDFVLQCRTCIGAYQKYQKKDYRAPNHAMCQVCKAECHSCSEFSTKKTPKMEELLRQENGGEDPITKVKPELLNNAKTLIFRCTSCKRGYHFEHLPPLTQNEVVPEDLRKERIEEYSMVDWRCKDCVNAKHTLQSLVAWRPIDQTSFVPGTTCLDMTEDQIEYLVKWNKCSHFHDCWMPGAWVFGTAASSTRVAFHRREENMHPKMTSAEAINEEWLLADVLLKVKYKRQPATTTKAKDLGRVSDVKEVFVKFQGLPYTEAVWDTPPPRHSGAAWEAFHAAYHDYVQGYHFPYVSPSTMDKRIKDFRDLDYDTSCKLKVQPEALKKGQLMGYQLHGVNWLLLNFQKGLSCVLADEMGLGKTIQVVALLATLVTNSPKCWPFLIVVPSATCANWRRELKQWAPDLRVVSYYGGKAAQDLAFHNELFPDGIKAGMKAHVVIMSYEAALDAKTAFRPVKWAGLIVDEGQRLKNDASQLYLALQEMKIQFRLLLTGIYNPSASCCAIC